MVDIAEDIRNAKIVYIIGNGGSSSTANHFAADLVKMCGIKAISLCSNMAIVTAYANDDSYDNIFVDQLKVFLEYGDVLVAISTSGKSKNILNAIDYAKNLGIKVIEFPKGNTQEAENIHLSLVHEICKRLCE